jgi:hypothetical protein
VEPAAKSVSGIKDFLRGTLADIEAVEVRLHEARDLVREKLHALELAGDPDFQEALGLLEASIDKGDFPAGVPAEEFHERYRP